MDRPGRIVGLIGGMSWESSALYYRYLNELARERLGGLHSAKTIMWSFDFSEIEELQATGNWDEAGRRLADAALRLESAGAGVILLCTNTMHIVFDRIEAATSVPVIHIADATAEKLRAANIHTVGLIGTRYTMEEDFYAGRLKDRYGLEVLIPERAERDMIHRVIYDELCKGVVAGQSRVAYLAAIDGLRRAGAEAVILGCTEIGMLVRQEDVAIPLFDTTKIHAEAALG